MVINFNKTLISKKYKDKINDAYSVALQLLKVPCKDLEINIKFVGKKEIKSLNSEFRNKDAVTDVLSFPNLLQAGVENEQIIVGQLKKENYMSDINRENGCIFLGDICICKSVVWKQAKEYGNSKLREMTYMAVHGLLHLLGYDHMVEDDKKNMRKAEENIMKKINLERN